MNRKNASLLIPFALILLLLFFLTGRRSPFGRSNTSFSVSEKKEINGIDLIQGDNKVYLRNRKGEWLIDNNSEARKPAVLMLLKVLRGIEIKSPVSADVFNEEIVKHAVNPVRVIVYRGRMALKSFYIYSTESNRYGNIMKMKPSSKPYIVYLPGYEDDIGSLFSPLSRYWKPFIAFRILPSEIESVSVENHRDSSSSFVILRRGSYYSMQSEFVENSAYDSIKIKRFISYFTNVPFESWDSGPANGNAPSSAAYQAPFMTIEVRTKGGETVSLNLYEKQRLVNGNIIPDTDRLLGELNNSREFFVMRYFDVDPILKKRSFFLRE